jgi:predicted dehydrogenase
MTDPFSRREFLKKSGAGAGLASMAGPAVLRSLGANERINVGCIGLGIRGEYLLKFALQIPKVRVAGLCDAYDGYIARAKADMEKAGQPGSQAEVFPDYRALLGSKKIDAVIIATPEHWHHRMGLDAIDAGKDMYLEKALAHTIGEGDELVKAANANPKLVIQVGTQNRSNPIYLKAREIYQSGQLGKVKAVRAFWYRNSLPADPAWRYAIPADASPSTCRWEQFLGPAAKRPFDPKRMFQWRLYWDYSQGIATDLMTHQLDIIHYITGETAPKTIVANGGIYSWPDGREVPDNWHTIFQYGNEPDGFMVQYSSMFSNSKFQYGEQFLGSEGTLECVERKTLLYTPEAVYAKKYPERKPITMNATDLNPKDSVLLHLENWAECVANRDPKTTCPVPVAETAATPCHLAIDSFRAHRQVTWNAATRKATLA